MAISAQPTEGLSYSPLDAHYHDADALQGELTRVFDICHGCRLCFKYCPTFPMLFARVDAHDGDVLKLTQTETSSVVDSCYQCKLCYNACPYTPGEGHAFQLDFPRLMARAKAQQRQRKGLKLRERLLGQPDLLARLARPLPGVHLLANIGNRIGPWRALLARVLGIHKHKLLPEFAGVTFQQWFDKHHKRGQKPLPTASGRLRADDHTNGEVFLFQTCFVNYNRPEIGKAAVAVLRENRVGVRCDYQNCCGMPALDSGDVPAAQRLARRNIAQLLPHAQAGRQILAINPTCSLMLRQEYPELVGGAEARLVADAVQDPCEFLNGLRKAGQANLAFQSTPGTVYYHVPCHLRAQNIGFRSRDLLRAIPQSKVKLVAECCGHDGTWAMKQEYFELSLQAGEKAFAAMREGTAGVSAESITYGHTLPTGSGAV